MAAGTCDLATARARRLDGIGVVGGLGTDEPQVDHGSGILERHSQDRVVEGHEGDPRHASFRLRQVAVVDRAERGREAQFQHAGDGAR